MAITADQFSHWTRRYVAALAVTALCQAELAAQSRQAGPTLTPAAPVVEEPQRLPDSESDQAHKDGEHQDPAWHEYEIEPGGPLEAMTLTMDDARSMVLHNSRVLQLAALAIQEKRFAKSVASKDYYPKLLGSAWSFQFNDDLGSVVRTPGVFLPATAVSVPIVNQNASGVLVTAVQPITPLLKVKQAVNVAAADVRIAETNIVKARRELSKGIDELYCALYILQQGREQSQAAVSSAEEMAKKAPSPVMDLVVIQAKQGLHSAEAKISDLTAQMNSLLELPLDTRVILAPPNPVVPLIASEEEAVACMMSSSPEICEAQANVAKAEAARKLAKADFIPTVAVMGLYSAQNTTDLIQDDFTGVGITATHTLFEWGKKKQFLCERETTLALAHKNLRYTIETERLKAVSAYRTFVQAEQAAMDAESVAKIYRELPLSKNNPTELIEGLQQRVAAETAVATTQIAYRTAYAELMAVTGRSDHIR